MSSVFWLLFRCFSSVSLKIHFLRFVSHWFSQLGVFFHSLSLSHLFNEILVGLREKKLLHPSGHSAKKEESSSPRLLKSPTLQCRTFLLSTLAHGPVIVAVLHFSADSLTSVDQLMLIVLPKVLPLGTMFYLILITKTLATDYGGKLPRTRPANRFDLINHLL